MKITAVEWLSKKTFIPVYLLEQAKEMEKQQELMHNKMLEMLKIISNGFYDSKKHLIIKKAKELIK